MGAKVTLLDCYQQFGFIQKTKINGAKAQRLGQPISVD